MVHLPLVSSFSYPDDHAQRLVAALERVASEFTRENPAFLLCRRGVVAEAEYGGSIFLEFAEVEAITKLRAAATALAGPVSGTESDGAALRFALMQHAGVTESVFRSAVTFAEGLVEGLELPSYATLGQLVFIRFESDAAGEDWSTGGWTTDLRWRILASYPL